MEKKMLSMEKKMLLMEKSQRYKELFMEDGKELAVRAFLDKVLEVFYIAASKGHLLSREKWFSCNEQWLGVMILQVTVSCLRYHPKD
jgi:hypothetical protein